jgi:hypothetical protein
MPITIQNYLADAAVTAADGLVTAFLQLPEDKRDWKPAEGARSALNQLIECVLLNGYSVDLIQTHQFRNEVMGEYEADSAKASAMTPDELFALLKENTGKVADAIRAVPDGDMDIDVVMPWNTQKLSELISYPYWNLSYHTAQINYIASLLGCLK